MNTSKDNFEFQIRKQINEREVTPSRDLWSEIELHNSMNNRPKSQMNWFLVAACLILAFSLGTLLFFLREPSGAQPKVAKEAGSAEAVQRVSDSEKSNISLITESSEKVKHNKASSQENKDKEVSRVLAVEDKKLILKETSQGKKPEMIQITNPKIIAKADSAKIPAKKKKYVDPSTLLFSVEHKDVIEKTKDGSNVATIDLNSK
ncbi:hypothetical protein F3J23_17910 [Chryseobacterium sp. Tr-659]|uniref:hypothetical protein n=1 Tax=Chryseobacterium sp. Tr-659 TaxID=2608340 RepID=UPI00142063CC|nr:hypothetical protein [Chryseobacterium sp. Tr-659]NIF07299.1 hypothetical protein [Chryseobacterium sp. Tr-659]